MLMQHVIEQKPNTNVKISLGNTDSWILFLGGFYLKLSLQMSLEEMCTGPWGSYREYSASWASPNFSSKNLLCCLENYA